MAYKTFSRSMANLWGLIYFGCVATGYTNSVVTTPGVHYVLCKPCVYIVINISSSIVRWWMSHLIEFSGN